MSHALNVAIVGGGPVGLTLAVILQNAGHRVRIFERDAGPEVRISGGTLDLHRELGQRALHAAGLLEGFHRLARITRQRAADPSGVVLMDEVPEAPEIDRTDLRRLALGALAKDTVRWGRKLSALNGTELHFEDGSREEAALVIGADGGRSRVRPHVTDVEPRETGTFVMQGEIGRPFESAPDFAALTNGGNLMVRGRGVLFFSTTRGDGSINFYVSTRQPDAQVRELLADWAPPFQQALTAASGLTPLPMRVVPADWQRRPDAGPVTVVGDAAHLMPPFGGVGVNIGLVNVLHLANALKSHAPVLEALREYEREMRQLALPAQIDTAQSELMLHSDVPLEELMAARDSR
ncbi:NAD(P)/FAD-dependent oxidoreductase [Vitiosangium sp. GDMCC 1.1324]|uniref:FAD-dependent oxidoreductase n=1 Tax=Vitiosangium sp. (strain GDMCC 1.1324) TaxID=2138576 RepID=UPI000D34389C|nr:NAD(P)/FAD-dependent oxidoreductase [Vitiosangium sp. GDMCC 1.1324]PTL80182.1 hypothetical protein DAT35_29685 [Vitiosangium sp. GDMCC 1.1324]